MMTTDKSRADALTDQRVEAAAIAMHELRRDLAKGVGDRSFDMAFDALPDEIKEVDRALARAALLAASPVEQPAAAPIDDEVEAAARQYEGIPLDVARGLARAAIAAASPADERAALQWTAGTLQEIVSGRWTGAKESDKVSFGSVTKTVAQVLDMADAALGRASQGAMPADVREPDAYVPIHPRNGPLWANTVTSLDTDRPKSYPVQPVYLVAPAVELASARASSPNETGAEGAKPCETCGGRGEVGGWRAGDGYDAEACPTCAVPAQAAEPAVIPIGYICADDLKQLAEGNGAIVSPRCRETDVPVFASAPAQAAMPDEATFQRLFIKHGGPVDGEGWCINESGLRDFLHELAGTSQPVTIHQVIHQVWVEESSSWADVTPAYYAERQPSNRRRVYYAPQPAQADARDEDAYVAKRLSEVLASVYTTLVGDDKADADENLNAIERVERAAQVLRLEVELYRGQADAREGLTADDVSELKGMTSDPRLFEAEREAIRKAVALLQGVNHAE